MELDSLPTEIIWNILARVPTLDLIRFQCVCKRWKSVTEEPCFHQLHISCSTSDPMNNQFLVLQQECDRLSFVDLSDEKRVVTRELEYRISKYGEVKYHNGLLCYVNEFDKRIIIMNPFTNQRVLLPILDDMESPYFVDACGFVFDPTTNFYEVVAVLVENDPPDYDLSMIFKIFDGGSKRWRSVTGLPCPIINWNIQVLVNERLHWMGQNNIVSFELTNEKFSLIRLPKGSLENRQLMAFGGKLCIVNHHQQGNTLQLQVWVMQEYGVEESWANNFNLEHIMPFEIETEELHVVLAGEAENGRVLLICDQETMLFYGLKGEKLKFLGSEELPIDTQGERPTSIHIANLCSIIS